MTFNFTVRGDKITEDKEYLFTEGNKGSYEAIFDFGEEWDELAKMCIVRSGDKKYSIPIFGSSCLLPELNKSSAKIGVVGVDALNEELVTRISTNMLGIGVQGGAYDEETAEEFSTTAEVWEQYLTEMENSRRAAETAKMAAQAASGAAVSAKEEALGYATLARQKAEGAEESARKAKESEVAAASSAEEAKEVTKTNRIGVRVPEGGVVLGDLENNHALAPFTTAIGNGCIAGMKGYYYSSVEFGKAIDKEYYGPCVITLSNKQWEAPAKAFKIGYSVGDVISMVNNSKYPDCATITAINKNVITVDKLPFNAIEDIPDGYASDDYSVFVAKKPLAGDVPLGHGAFASGEGAIALERAAAAIGRLVIALEQYSFAANRETIAGYCAAAFCLYAQALGIGSFAINYKTLAKAAYTFAAGFGTVAGSEAQAVFGRRNIVDEDGKYIFILGNGTSINDLSNAFTVDWDGNAWFSGAITAGRETTDDDNDLVLVNKGFLKNYVKNTDYATRDEAGLVKISSTGNTYGIRFSSDKDKVLEIVCASEKDIRNKTSRVLPIVPANLEYAVQECTNQDIETELTEKQLKLPPSTQFMKDYVEEAILGGAW